MFWFKRKKKIGGWLSTHTGRKVYPLDLKDEDIDIKDIAWSLSCQVRYVGQGGLFYSVAQHSVLVADILQVYLYRRPNSFPLYLPLAGLLHDACEAYLGDFPGPIKHVFPDFVAAEKIVETKIWAHFGISLSDYEKVVVGNVDKMTVAYEMPFLGLPMFDSPLTKIRHNPLLVIPIKEETQIESFHAFLDRFYRLGIGVT